MKETFLDYNKKCWKVQLKVTKKSIERVDILVCDHERMTLVFLYMSSMQLNIEIRESIWFLMTHVMVLGASNSAQTCTYKLYQYKPLESHFLLHYRGSTLIDLFLMSSYYSNKLSGP